MIIHVNNFKKFFLFCSIILILLIVYAIYTAQFRKNNIYLLYPEDTNCSLVDNYKKEMFDGFLCHNNIILFFKKKESEKVQKLKKIDDLKFQTKQSLFDKVFLKKESNTNYYLVKKQSKIYEVIPIKIFEFVS